MKAQTAHSFPICLSLSVAGRSLHNQSSSAKVVPLVVVLESSDRENPKYPPQKEGSPPFDKAPPRQFQPTKCKLGPFNRGLATSNLSSFQQDT